jgi:hypothetical protein
MISVSRSTGAELGTNHSCSGLFDGSPKENVRLANVNASSSRIGNNPGWTSRPERRLLGLRAPRKGTHVVTAVVARVA